MQVVIAGGHGKIALILERMLSDRGDSVAGLIRNSAQAPDLEQAAAEPLIVDLEKATVEQVATHLVGANAVVFAAGAGPGSGIARKETVDRDAAILLADAAEAAGVGRYLLISARDPHRYQNDEGGDPVFQAYLQAKAAADDAVIVRTALNPTIVRPGRLTNDPGTGRVTIADSTGPGSIPREDVAAVLVALLDNPSTGGQIFEVISGDTQIDAAVAARSLG